MYIYNWEKVFMIDYYLVDKNTVKLKTTLNKELVQDVYRNMLILRLIEEYANSKYKKGNIRGFCHLVIGQENIYMSLQKVLDKNDKVIGSYRCHGLAFICGISIESIIGELLGKAIGNCKGKGGSMHLYNDQFYGGHGIVGAQVSLGTGLGFALQYKKVKNVAFVFFGDGAANQGQVWESFNMAALWKLPVVYVCENNHYSMWTPESNSTTYPEYFKRGYNIPGIRLTDKNITQLIDVFTFARQHAIEKGPIILQIDTYRTCGHSCLDVNDFYRSTEEINEKKNNDCLKEAKNNLQKFATCEEVKIIEDEVISCFEEGVKKVIFSKEPDIDELLKDVYSE